jgi:membrane associated rhomboid family serine protease
VSVDDASGFGTDGFYRSIGRAFVTMCAVVPVLFAVDLIDQILPADLVAAGGIWPRRVSGLDGILFAPFLHDDFAHLNGNSAALIPLGTFVLAAGTRRFVGVTVVAMLTSGLGVWSTGDPGSPVIGASGVIFGYLGFVLARGAVERSRWNIAVALLIGLLYGWQLVLLLPTDAGISWQGHLFGFAGGVLAALLLRPRWPYRSQPAAGSVPDSGSDVPRADPPAASSPGQ